MHLDGGGGGEGACRKGISAKGATRTFHASTDIGMGVFVLRRRPFFCSCR